MSRQMAMMPRDFDIITPASGRIEALEINNPYTSIVILVDGTEFSELRRLDKPLTAEEMALIGGPNCVRGEVFPAAWRIICVSKGAVAAFRG